MREEKTFRLGRVRIDGDLIDLEPDDELAFEADRRDLVNVGIAYDYRERSEEKERTRVRITAHLDGDAPQSFEAVIGDHPVLNDSRRGFVSVPIKIPRAGEHKGRFRVEASYASGPWGEKEPDAAASEAIEGEFTLRVR